MVLPLSIVCASHQVAKDTPHPPQQLDAVVSAEEVEPFCMLDLQPVPWLLRRLIEIRLFAGGEIDVCCMDARVNDRDVVVY